MEVVAALRSEQRQGGGEGCAVRWWVEGAGGSRLGLKGAPGISGGRAPEGKAGVDGGITARPLRGEIRGR